VLHSVKANNGVVHVNFYNQFVHCKSGDDPKDATLAHVADHIQYIGELIGWDHVGIGADFDGIFYIPTSVFGKQTYRHCRHRNDPARIGRREQIP
jgi:membrane dipeptidase